jgi:hypothetical protein
LLAGGVQREYFSGRYRLRWQRISIHSSMSGGVRMSDHLIIFILMFGTAMFVLAGLERMHGREKSSGHTWRK